MYARTVHLIGLQRSSSGPNGPHLTSLEIGLASPRNSCHPIGTEEFNPYVRIVTAYEMLLNRDVYDTSLLQSIINDDRLVLSPIDAVIAGLTVATWNHYT